MEKSATSPLDKREWDEYYALKSMPYWDRSTYHTLRECDLDDRAWRTDREKRGALLEQGIKNRRGE